MKVGKKYRIEYCGYRSKSYYTLVSIEGNKLVIGFNSGMVSSSDLIHIRGWVSSVYKGFELYWNIGIDSLIYDRGMEIE